MRISASMWTGRLAVVTPSDQRSNWARAPGPRSGASRDTLWSPGCHRQGGCYPSGIPLACFAVQAAGVTWEVAGTVWTLKLRGRMVMVPV